MFYVATARRGADLTGGSGESELGVPSGVLRIGQAGWALTRKTKNAFPAVGTHLERYAEQFNAVEINSSFYRPHRPETYARWAASVPPDFRFSVKVPKAITHESELSDLDRTSAFVDEIRPLADKQGPLLVQLPPKMAFNGTKAGLFFERLRALWRKPIVCEPRHLSWFSTEADLLLKSFQVGRVWADPSRGGPSAERWGGWADPVYVRLHGSPRIYYSAYTSIYLKTLSERLIELSATADVWCIFDNTALGAAVENALELKQRLSLRTEAPLV